MLTVFACTAAFSGCANKPVSPLDQFATAQKTKIVEASFFDDANFIFSAAAYIPTLDDLASLKQAWFEFGNSFPESSAISNVETETKKGPGQAVIVALFMTEYENADLRNKSMGWAVGPAPVTITELAERDVPLRTLMPIKNDWARYYLLTYPKDKFGNETAPRTLIVSNRISKVELKLAR
ncbi:MAG: hypothetical protein HYW49_08355 [Deltaproteobacteria bacterium]|nr:hypothetical protein [Deltaproteobacteria bacterium]